MFSLLESKKEIAKAQRTLETTIRLEFGSRALTNIGYPGGTERDARVHTDGTYWFWSSVITSKAASCDHFKTGQWSSTRDDSVVPCRGLLRQEVSLRSFTFRQNWV